MKAYVFTALAFLPTEHVHVRLPNFKVFHTAMKVFKTTWIL